MLLSLTDFPAGSVTSLRTDHEGVDSLTQGVAQYQVLGVPPAKLVTIFAWFGMDVQCVNPISGSINWATIIRGKKGTYG